MKTGAVIGGLIFIGGAIVMWSLFSTIVNAPLLITGLGVLLIAFVLFIKELLKI